MTISTFSEQNLKKSSSCTIQQDTIPAEIYDNDPMIEELVDFIISKDLIRIGDPVNLGRLYKEIVCKDWFMTLLDVKDYIQTKEQMLADYEDEKSVGKENAGEHCESRILLF